jgi:hypothetical protein
MTKKALGATVLGAMALLAAPAAQASDGDQMYAVGTDIQPGTYRYTVTGNDMGDWKLYSDANCKVGAGLIDIEDIHGEGHTGYLTIPASAKYVKTYYLTLTPMR